jgi:FixJ family two-component response regulator
LEFLIKPFEEEVLRETIRGAIQRSAAALGREAELRILRERHALLSNREREVMALIVSGLMNKQVGGKLGISEITVKAHRGRVMRKMGAVSFADLIYISAKLDIMRNS